MRFPEFPIVNAFDALPDFGFSTVFVPAGSEVAVIKPKHLRRKL